MKKGSYFGGYILGVLVAIFVLLKMNGAKLRLPPTFGAGQRERHTGDGLPYLYHGPRQHYELDRYPCQGELKTEVCKNGSSF